MSGGVGGAASQGILPGGLDPIGMFAFQANDLKEFGEVW